MKKFPFALPLAALLLAIAASAFTLGANEKDAPVVMDRHHYKLTSEAGIFDAANWEPADPSYPSCTGNGLPCVIEISGDLQTFLDNAEANGGVDDLVAVAESQQP